MSALAKRFSVIKNRESYIMAKTRFDKILTFQGRSMRKRIIKQKEQRYERNKKQIHRTALGGTFNES